MVTFALNCLHECRNWILSVRRKNLTKITIFWKKTKFLFINADLQIAVFGFWLSNFCRLVKSPNHVSVEIFFSDDAVFSKIHSHIQTISVLNEAIRSFQNYCGKFVKDNFYVSKWTIRGDFVLMKYLLPFLNGFGTWQTKLRTLAILAGKIWAGSSKLFLASLEEDFEVNLFFLPFTVFFSFSKFEQVKLWNHQNFSTCRQYCIPCVTWIILNDKIFFWNNNFFSTSLELWVEKSLEFSDLFRRRCQKCNSRVQKTLRGKIIKVILLKWVHFDIFFEVWTEEKVDCSKRQNNRSVENALQCP